MRRSLLTPLSVLVSGCVLIMLLLFQPDAGSNAATRAQTEPYEPPTQTAFAAQTQTAEAEAEVDEPYQPPEGTAANRTAVPTRTSSPRGTPTRTPAAGARTPTTTATQEAEFDEDATITPTRTATPEEIGTPTPTPDPNSLVCLPGETVTIRGEGPPNAGFLLYFNKRVVSGGSVGKDGRFAIGLTVGAEQGGSYPVEVRVRGTRQLLKSLACNVPATTPTPIVPQPQR